MIYKSYLVEQNKNLLKNHKNYLFYGENIGLLDLFNNDIKYINKESEINTFFQNEIINNKDLLLNEIMNESLFSKNKIYIIKEATDKIYKILEEAILKNSSNINIYIFSTKLDKKSKLRLKRHSKNKTE